MYALLRDDQDDDDDDGRQAPSSSSGTRSAAPQFGDGVASTSGATTHRQRGPEPQLPPRRMLLDDESDTDDEDYRLQTAHSNYMYKRNIPVNEAVDPAKISKNIIQFLNINFIENNLATLSLETENGINQILEARKELKSLQNWYLRQTSEIDKKEIGSIRAPMLCRIYLEFFSERNRETLSEVLEEFQCFFTGSKSYELLRCLLKFTIDQDYKKIPVLERFKNNKYIFIASPKVMNNFFKFLEYHKLLEMIFHTFFVINYTTVGNETEKVFEAYFKTKINNREKANAPKQNNNDYRTASVSDVGNDNVKSVNLTKKKLNTSQNSKEEIPSSPTNIRDSKNHYNDEQIPSTSKGFFNEQQELSNPESLSSNKTQTKNDKSTEKIEVPPKVQQSESKLECPKSDDKRKNDDQSSSYEKESRKLKKSRSDENSSSSFQNIPSDIQDNVNTLDKADEKELGASIQQKEEKNVSTKFQTRKNRMQLIVENEDSESSSSDEKLDEDESMSNEADEPRTQKVSSGKRQSSYDIYSSNSSRCSSDDTSEDSDCSSDDEETIHRQYIRNQIKPRPSYRKPRASRYTNITKIEVKNLNSDPYLCSLKQIILTNCSKVSCTLLTSDHKYVAAGTPDSTVYLWRRSSIPVLTHKSVDSTDQAFEDISKIENKYEKTQVSLKNSQQYIEKLDKNVADILRGHSGPVFDLAEIAESKIILSASYDNTFRAWHLESLTCLEVYDAHVNKAWCICTSPTLMQIATGSSDGTSCLWFLSYTGPLRIYPGHRDDILVLKFHPNELYLATGSSDKTIRLYDVNEGKCIRLYCGHRDYITCLEFHPTQATVLASACAAGKLIVWDIPTGVKRWKLKVGKVLFTDIAWLTSNIFAASISTGVVLKCDFREKYLNPLKRVSGFETIFNRLTSLKRVNSILYAIGIATTTAPTAVSKTGSKRFKPNASRKIKNERLQSQQQQPNQKSHTQKQQIKDPNLPRDPSPLSRLFFPRHIIESNGNSMTLLNELSSTSTNQSASNLQFQVSPNSINTLQEQTLLLQNDGSFNLINQQVIEQDPIHQSSTISLTQNQMQPMATKVLAAPQNIVLKNNFHLANTNLGQVNDQQTNINIPQPSQQNLQPINLVNASQQLANWQIPLQQQVSNIQLQEQEQLGYNQLTNLNIQQLQLQTVQESSLPTNMYIQPQQQLLQLQTIPEQNQTASMSVQLQPQQQQVKLRPTIQLNNLTIQQQQLKQRPTIQLTNMTVQRNQLQQQPTNIQLANLNIQSQQPSNIQLTNVSAPQLSHENILKTASVLNLNDQQPGPSSRLPGTPVRLPLKPRSRPKKVMRPLPGVSQDDYDRVRKTVIERLRHSNPEIFGRNPTVLNQFARPSSSTTTQSLSNVHARSFQSQQNEDSQD